ncbi:MAG: zinc-dependent metalloprotease [Nocardioides sp.]
MSDEPADTPETPEEPDHPGRPEATPDPESGGTDTGGGPASGGKPAEPGPGAGNPFEELFTMLGGLGGQDPFGLGRSGPGPTDPLGGRLRGGFGMSGDFGGPNDPAGDPLTGPAGDARGPAGGFGAGIPGLGQIFGQMQALMQPYDGPINWQYAIDIARQTAAQESDPSPSLTQQRAVADAIRLADHWLDDTTGFPSGVVSTAAWSRAEWIENTTDVWKVLVEPVAGQAIGALTSVLPEEAKSAMGPLLEILSRASGTMFASQAGSALGAVAGEVLTASDIGLPLGPAGKAAIVPINVAAFQAGLDSVTTDDVLLYLALREAAHQRLFAGVPWLRDYLIGLVTTFARDIQIDTENIQQQMQGMGSLDPASIQEAMQSGMFEPQKSPAQEAALKRLEVALALVEGWVDEVVGQATAARMPAAAKLQEAVRRRRAAGGPAEQTFATLVGLELRPRRLRDASTLWGSLRQRQGPEARDGVWMHPDLLPTPADLDDPLGFREDAAAPAELSEADFDAGLRDLLDPKTPPEPPPADPDAGTDP